MKEITDKEFMDLRNYIKANFGINLGMEKKSFIYSRLRTILVEKGFQNFTDYYNYLLSDKSGLALVSFIDKITTNHTFFMRETDHFNYLRETVLPMLEEKYHKEKDLRLWCAGCSSGEEAYTLKILVEEHFKDKGWNTDILATDISSTVLSKAYAGKYPAEAAETLPPSWLSTYFSKTGDTYTAKDILKKGIIFRKFNLMNPTFNFKKKFQVIFCRNVMIYFDLQTRLDLVDRFYSISEPDAHLFIGHSESLSNTKTKYKYIMPAVYKKE